jgi:hypothetical protein
MKKHTRLLLRLLAGSAFLFAGFAHAQYAWVDAKGIHHYSDQPPPPSTPPAKILKAPRPRSALPLAQQAAAPDAPDTPEAAPAPKAKAPPALAEREADFRKRVQEREKQEQKAGAEAQRKAALAENCESARRYKAELESGIRVASTGADGERAFISDEERASRVAKTNAVLQGCR